MREIPVCRVSDKFILMEENIISIKYVTIEDKEFWFSLSSSIGVLQKLRSISISSPCHCCFVLYYIISFSFPYFSLIRVRKILWEDITQGKV